MHEHTDGDSLMWRRQELERIAKARGIEVPWRMEQFPMDNSLQPETPLRRCTVPCPQLPHTPPWAQTPISGQLDLREPRDPWTPPSDALAMGARVLCSELIEV